ncbi:Response regulator PleD [Symbiodinium microadriaticum]|uniref:Response regulator PleD n=1 Tax=Symbiodinium microadriaticum TaxID=2951 RepID=A0A1Q9E5R1_SYMMI|nr:Response regulator PleD [Symbiodinium microadriaticum]
MDGQSALDWLELNKNNLPDVILLDIQMPGMTGYEVCRRIRENYNESLWAPASAVAMEGFQSGSTDFMAKPFDQDLLRKKVSLSLDMKRSLPISPKNRRQASKPNMPSRKEAAALLREHEEHVQSLEAQMADQAQEIAMLQEELRKAREPPCSQDLRARSSSPETRQKIRKQHVEAANIPAKKKMMTAETNLLLLVLLLVITNGRILLLLLLFAEDEEVDGHHDGGGDGDEDGELMLGMWLMLMVMMMWMDMMMRTMIMVTMTTVVAAAWAAVVVAAAAVAAAFLPAILEVFSMKETMFVMTIDDSYDDGGRWDVLASESTEEEHLMSELAGMRQRNMQVAKRLLLQNQHLQRIQCAEEAQADVDPGEDDFFGCEALRKQISEFNPFEPEDDAAPDMPEKFAAMCDWNKSPPSPILAKSST